MYLGDIVPQRKHLCVTECGFLNGKHVVTLENLFLDPAVQAANAIAARDAAAARFLLTSEQLAACREKNNPYNQWGGGINQDVTWAVDAPDPCRKQWIEATKAHQELQHAETQLSGTTTTSIPAIQVGARTNAPTTQDIASAPAPQLATSQDPVGLTDPAIPISEFTTPDQGMECDWSPSSIEEVMLQILEEMETNQIQITPQILETMDTIESNMQAMGKWWAWSVGKKAGIKWKPKNQSWVGKWLP